MKTYSHVRSPIPLYYRIQMELREAIVSGKWRPGDEIPSEAELQKTYDCSRRTVQQAIEGLVHDGLLTRKRGKGTFVTEWKIVQPVGRIYSTSETIRARGQEPGTELIELREVDAEPFRERLDLPDTVHHVYILERLRLADNEPLSLIKAILPGDLLPNFEAEIPKRISLYEVLEKVYDLRLVEADEVVSAVSLSASQARWLETDPGSPALKIRRITWIDTGRIIEYMEEFFRADRFHISLRLVGRDMRGGDIGSGD